jgi:UDP:flavonoid glycosyltransferase YjiC (YdhE family)
VARPLRLLFYAVNGLGLGHVVRLLAIARKVRRRAPDAEILFLTSSEADSIVYREGFAALKVPSKNIREESGLRKKTFLKLVQSVVWSAVNSFDPDTLVVDTFPVGNLQELAPLLTWELRKIFVFREQREEMARRPILQNALRLYDRVIVPHDETSEVPLPEGMSATKVGPILIRDEDELFSREEARRRLGLASDATVVYASFGGGGDPEVDRCLRLVLQAVRERPSWQVVLAPGPLYRGENGDGREARAASGGVLGWLGVGARGRPVAASETAALLHDLDGRAMVLDHFPAIEVFRAFDLSVAGVGYNTSHELLHAGVPGVYIPFPRVVDDQGARARWIADAGAGLALAAPDFEGVRDALSQLAEPGVREAMSKRARRMVPQSGADRAARIVLEAGVAP